MFEAADSDFSLCPPVPSPGPIVMRELELQSCHELKSKAEKRLVPTIFHPSEETWAAVLQEVEKQELMPVPQVGKSSPLGVKLQSLME